MKEILYTSHILDAILNSSARLFSHEKEIIHNAYDVFRWQKDLSYERTQSFEKATYRILTFEDYLEFQNRYDPIFFDRTVFNKFEILFFDKSELLTALEPFKGKKYSWKWKYSKDSPGYEVTTRGDSRFSPFCMRIYTIKGTTISEEDYFKRHMKPLYESGKVSPGDGWGHRIFKEYLENHLGLLYELSLIGSKLPFTDMFDKDGGQNKFWADILNEYHNAD